MNEYEPIYGSKRVVNGRIVYDDVRDEIRAFKQERSEHESK